MQKITQTLKTEGTTPFVYNIVIFANLESGGKLGRKIRDAQVRSIELTEVSNTSVHFFIINNQKSREAGLSYLHQLCKDLDMKSNRIVALAGGGDGTVNWLLALLIQHRIDFGKVIFGAFPLGTGNDFAKNLGWREYSLFENNFSELHDFVVEVQKAYIEQFDIWEVEAWARQNKGYIVKQKHVDNMIYLVNEESESSQRHLTKRFTNYFSFGMDARVGFDFNRHRSQKQLVNYVLYFLIGCFNKFRSLPDITQIVTKMEQSKQVKASHKVSESMDIPISSKESPRDTRASEAQLETTSTIFSKQSADVSEKYRNIVALNINSYMGGVPNIWENSWRSGANLTQKDKMFRPTSHSDGILQFMSFKDEWSLGFERVFKGRGRKMAQGSGPFKFTFQESCKETYLNYDGQYYKIYNPKEIVVRLCPYFEKVPLRVLRCNNSK